MRSPLVIAAALLAAGCAAHGAVPVEESGGHTPEMIRQLLSGRVLVRDRPNGHLVARHYRPDGTYDYCGADDDGAARSYAAQSQRRWVVGADARGRATYQLKIKGKSRRLYVPHYDPETGELKFRRWDKVGSWITASYGWLQDSWPAVMRERCPGLAAGVQVDERQTAMTLAELRRQTPDAALKGLATPLPPAVGKQAAAPASGVLLGAGGRDPVSQLSDELVAGGKAHALAFMGEAYAERRFVFIGDGSLVVVDWDGNLAAGEGFEGNWRWAEGRLELRVAGDRTVHSIAWRELARQLGLNASAAEG